MVRYGAKSQITIIPFIFIRHFFLHWLIVLLFFCLTVLDFSLTGLLSFLQICLHLQIKYHHWMSTSHLPVLKDLANLS